MDKNKRKRLEAKGWKIGSVGEFLGISESEMDMIEEMEDTKNTKTCRLKENLEEKI